jgi:hypothetical protein
MESNDKSKSAMNTMTIVLRDKEMIKEILKDEDCLVKIKDKAVAQASKQLARNLLFNDDYELDSQAADIIVKELFEQRGGRLMLRDRYSSVLNTAVNEIIEKVLNERLEEITKKLNTEIDRFKSNIEHFIEDWEIEKKADRILRQSIEEKVGDVVKQLIGKK